ncbi:N-acetylmuramoyl-L-alanine amidase [Candidatus Kryptobacter tengchongensis]|nr:N-acetylmuramoyl-L-alanine amidase [Candidatus Kryptobacter tengchongensis]
MLARRKLNFEMFVRRLLKYLVLILLIFETLNADVFKVKINNKIEVIPAFREAKTLYISLPDLLGLLGIEYRTDTLNNLLTFKVSDNTFKFISENPFIVVSSGDEVKIFQIPVEVISGAGKIFVPVKYFSEIFSRYFPHDFKFDEKNNMIIISISEPVEVSLPKFDVYDVKVEKRKNGYLFKILTARKISDYEVWLGRNNWLYITIANAKVDISALKNLSAPELFSDIEVIPHSRSVQISFKLKPKIKHYEVIADKNGTDILISLYIDEIISRIEDVKRKFLLDVVVIDAGHGGKDPGAIGVYGTREKDITLAVAKKLKTLIENLGIKVVMTREEDEFVELYRRGQIANSNGGKIFISLHCNSMPYKPHSANGFEVYILRPGKTEDAIRIAERENAVIKLEENYEERYKHLTDESYILTAMAHNVYVKNSERFAEILHKEAGKILDIKVNGVSQAGFYVLVGASMPSVLVEMGYLSNPEEEKYLRSETNQWKIARTIFNAVKKFKEEYEASIAD